MAMLRISIQKSAEAHLFLPYYKIRLFTSLARSYTWAPQYTSSRIDTGTDTGTDIEVTFGSCIAWVAADMRIDTGYSFDADSTCYTRACSSGYIRNLHS